MRFSSLLSVALGLSSIAAAPFELAPRMPFELTERIPPIVGGTVVDSASKYPYIAFLSFSGYVCGGTILSTRTIITAAHCTYDGNGNSVSASAYSIRVGSLRYGSGGTIVGVTSYTRHSSYSASTVDYDVAVLKLSSALTFGTTIAAASLVGSGTDPVAGTTVTTIGWGLTSESGSSISSVLREVNVLVVARATCAADYSGEASVTDRMFCAAASGKDSCSGDSGGPIINTSTGVLLGGVSWGFGCAEAAYPGVYASYGNAPLNSFIVSAVTAAGT